MLEERILSKIMRDENKIKERLLADFKKLEENGYHVVGVFLQGSQNYDLDYDGSDIDTKAIVIPTVEDMILGKQPESHTIVLFSNEHIDVKDIRVMHNCFKKQNINMLEILFSKYYYLNPEYADIYQKVIEHRELIARRNVYNTAKCTLGMIREKHHALTHPYPVNKDEIEEYGYAAKQLHHMFRCLDFLEQYVSGENFEKCLKPRDPVRLMRLKLYHDNALEDAIRLAAKCEKKAVQIVREFSEMSHKTFEECADEILNGVMVECVKRANAKNE